MRWADLDPLGHVNNVVYVDYLQEARIDMLRVHARGPATDPLADALIVVRHQVHYVRPALFTGETVMVEVWVTEVRAGSFTMAYEVFQERDGQRVVYLRASSVLAPFVFATESPRRLSLEERTALGAYLEPEPAATRERTEPRRVEAGHYPLRVRFSDLDPYGHVNNVAYLEYYQEARIAAITAAAGGPYMSDAGFPPMVVAQADVDYVQPILFRHEGYDMDTWVSRIGTTSMVMESVIRDAETVLSRGRFVLVFVDPATGRSAEPSPEVRRIMTSLA